MALDPNAEVPTEENGGTGTNTNDGYTTTTTANNTTGTSTSTQQQSANSSIVNMAKAFFGGAADAAATFTLTVNPITPKTENTRYNEATNSIEYLEPNSKKWVKVKVVLNPNPQKIDIAKFTAKEIQEYLSTGKPFPKDPVLIAAAKLTANSTTKTATKPKWWIYAAVALVAVGGLWGVWKYAKQRTR